jgi:transposase
MSRRSVDEVLMFAKEHNISSVTELSDDELYNLFFPERFQRLSENFFTLPDYTKVQTELKRVGVTLKLLWAEYCESVTNNGGIPVQYSKFCKGYNEFVAAHEITNHLYHKPGVRCEVDWCGSTMSYLKAITGATVKIYLFVGTLPYSQYTYVEPCQDMKQATWLRCHVHMYQFFGGVPLRTVCDNLKTGVIRHPREGEIVLNHDYESLGLYYHTAIMPTGVRKPKQKASVEGNVGNISTAIIAKLRNQRFLSFAELKTAVSKALTEFNDAPFDKREGSRKLVWAQEVESLQPLPAIPYEISEWKYGVKVGKDCHIMFGSNHYSCPFQYVGQEVSVRTTDTRLDIFLNDSLITTHPKFPSYVKNKYSTHEEDMPDEFNQPEFDERRIRDWAISIGENTATVIDRIFCVVAIKEQGYNPSLAILRLAKTYSKRELEYACSIALTKVINPRYRHIKSILAAAQDEKLQVDTGKSKSESKGLVRGADYYKENFL